MPPKWLILLWLAVSFLGFLNATYLTMSHYQGARLVCGSIGECNRVLSSPYATVGNVPIALIGAVYYLVLFLLNVAYLDTGRAFFLRIFVPLVVMGFSISLLLVFLQWVVIRSFCSYCLVSSAFSGVLFVSILGRWRRPSR